MDGGSYKGNLQCVGETDIWTCSLDQLPDQSDPNKPVGNSLSCRRIVDGVESVKELTPDAKSEQAGSYMSSTNQEYVNRTTYMNANLVNAQLYQFHHNEKNASKPPKGVIPNYSFAVFARDYMHWLYG